MVDPAIRERAKELFVENGFTVQTILIMLDGEVSRKTIYNWKKEDNWGALRIQKVSKQLNRRQKLESLLDKYIEEAEINRNASIISSIKQIILSLRTSSTFEFTEEKVAKEDNVKRGLTEENLREIEKKLDIL
jgi:hypothetical protein